MIVVRGYRYERVNLKKNMTNNFFFLKFFILSVSKYRTTIRTNDKK